MSNLSIYLKSDEKFQVLLKHDKNDVYFTWRLIHSLSHFFLWWEVFQMKFVEKFKPHVLLSIQRFFPENLRVYGTIWSQTSQRWQMAHADCMLDKYVYGHTLVYNMLFLLLLPAIIDKRTRLMLRYTYIICLLILTTFQLVAILLHLEVHRHTTGS